ncbi:hypothetical protein CWB35_18055 [Bacillus cereus]|nr:hypothetical protein [Bacillus cereus]
MFKVKGFVSGIKAKKSGRNGYNRFLPDFFAFCNIKNLFFLYEEFFVLIFEFFVKLNGVFILLLIHNVTKLRNCIYFIFIGD